MSSRKGQIEKRTTYLDELGSFSGLSRVSVLCYEDGLGSLDDDDTVSLSYDNDHNASQGREKARNERFILSVLARSD